MLHTTGPRSYMYCYSLEFHWRALPERPWQLVWTYGAPGSRENWGSWSDHPHWSSCRRSGRNYTLSIRCPTFEDLNTKNKYCCYIFLSMHTSGLMELLNKLKYTICVRASYIHTYIGLCKPHSTNKNRGLVDKMSILKSVSSFTHNLNVLVHSLTWQNNTIKEVYSQQSQISVVS